MTMTEFYAARLDDTELLARAYLKRADDRGTDRETWAYKLLLREVEAGRKIIALHTPDMTKYSPETHARLTKHGIYSCPVCATVRTEHKEDWGADRFPCLTLCSLAATWSDHPDYDEAWRP